MAQDLLDGFRVGRRLQGGGELPAEGGVVEPFEAVAVVFDLDALDVLRGNGGQAAVAQVVGFDLQGLAEGDGDGIDRVFRLQAGVATFGGVGEGVAQGQHLQAGAGIEIHRDGDGILAAVQAVGG